MSAPPFVLLFSPEAKSVLADLEGSAQYKSKLKKVRKALRLLQAVGPSHPGLRTHKYQSVPGPGGVSLYESYIENDTPSAWRMFWIYGSGQDTISIVTIGPHPD